MSEDRKRRKQRLRRYSVRGTIAAFVAAWAIVFGQLVLGHDPALGRPKTAQTQSQSTTQSQGTTSDDGTRSDDGTASDDGGSTSSSPAPVTSSQS
ncbi:MAG TPA: hypothetical protein VGF21_09670 [Thermoleophilaceae bacterium]